VTVKVAVVGAGLIGRAWAISYSRAGHDVALYDAIDGAAEAALGYVDSVLADLDANGLLNGHQPAAVRGRIKATASLAEALRDAVHVQENTPEKLDVKIEVFRELDRLAAPETVLASSTSALLPSSFSESLPGRARCLVVHPINPPYLVPAVEVVPAPWTDAAVVVRVGDFMRAAGYAPIMMDKELDGFVINRLQGAVLQEAFRLVAEGYASTSDVDIAIRDGLGLRWSFMGPFETIDLNAPAGVADYIARYEGLYKTLWQTQRHIVPWVGALSDRIETERRKKLSAPKLAERARWRDRRLMALLAHKRDANTKIGS
jgi:L-gulonate 3-dehydrogenase